MEKLLHSGFQGQFANTSNLYKETYTIPALQPSSPDNPISGLLEYSKIKDNLLKGIC